MVCYRVRLVFPGGTSRKGRDDRIGRRLGICRRRGPENFDSDPNLEANEPVQHAGCWALPIGVEDRGDYMPKQSAATAAISSRAVVGDAGKRIPQNKGNETMKRPKPDLNRQNSHEKCYV